MLEVTTEIPYTIQSQNKTDRMHWAEKAKGNPTLIYMLRAHLPVTQPTPVPRFCIIRSYRKRLVDFPNLVGGSKALVDAIVRVGYLWDDAPLWARFQYEQDIARDREHTSITIRDIPSSAYTVDQVDAVLKNSEETIQPWKKQQISRARNATLQRLKRRR